MLGCQKLPNSHYKSSCVFFLIICTSPGWCGSVGWAMSRTPQGRWLECMQEATHRCFSPSLSPSFLLSLESIKEKNLINVFVLPLWRKYATEDL